MLLFVILYLTFPQTKYFLNKIFHHKKKNYLMASTAQVLVSVISSIWIPASSSSWIKPRIHIGTARVWMGSLPSRTGLPNPDGSTLDQWTMFLNMDTASSWRLKIILLTDLKKNNQRVFIELRLFKFIFTQKMQIWGSRGCKTGTLCEILGKFC